jgi:hypothetical protein
MTDVEKLETEVAYFNEHRSEFLAVAPLKFVLIKGNAHHGFYDSALNAYKVGVASFGLQPFLIKEVLPQDRVYDIPAYSLGLLHASL